MAKHRRTPGQDLLNREEAADTPAYWSVDDSRWPALRPDLPADVADLLAPPIVVGVARVAPTSRLTPPGTTDPTFRLPPSTATEPARPVPPGVANAARSAQPAPGPARSAPPGAGNPARRTLPAPAGRGPAGGPVNAGRHRQSTEHAG
ncbi:hypothetical protein AB0C04_12145 [Micromonospora sp. NPDC048909]|uniref:hypothetical protein n=1 Tax=Micromonospora sp. NPDC048909 TaxID=3155643 RepID=UPI0034108F2E